MNQPRPVGARRDRVLVCRRRSGRSATLVVFVLAVALVALWLFVQRPNSNALFAATSPTQGCVFDELGAPYVGGLGLRLEVVEPFDTGPSLFAQSGWTDAEGRFELRASGLRVPASNDAIEWRIDPQGSRHDIDFTTVPADLRRASGVLHLGEELISGLVDLERVDLALPPVIGTLEIRPTAIGKATVVFVPRGIRASDVPNEWFTSLRALTIQAGEAVPIHSWDAAESWTILARASLGGDVGELVLLRGGANMLTLNATYDVEVNVDAGEYDLDSSTLFVCAIDASATPFAVDRDREAVKNWVDMLRHYESCATDSERVNLSTTSVTMELPIGTYRLELWRQDSMSSGPLVARDIVVSGDISTRLP